jgi:hypothetical protein
MSRLNPYRWNQVQLDLFYGRETLVDNLISNMLSGQSFALMGGRRMGKTTLLRKIEWEISSRFDSLKNGGLLVIPIYIDTLSFANLSTPDVISQRILGTANSLIDHYLVTRSEGDAGYSLSNPFAMKLLELVDRVPEYRVQMMILFDEISPIIEADWGTTYLGNWRALLHNSPPLSNYISAVFAGANEIVSLANDVSSPLANILSWKCLRPFSAENARLLIEEPSIVDLPKGFHERVYRISGGHPFIIQYLMFRVIQSRAQDLHESLEEARMYFLENEFRQFQNWFDDFDDMTQEIYSILLSEKTLRRQDLVRYFRGSGVQMRVQNSLNVLCSYGVARESDRQTYECTGGLFKSWYTENHKGDMNLLRTTISSPPIDEAFEDYWYERLAHLGDYNILVEGETDKLYLQIAAEAYRESNGYDLLNDGRIQIVAGQGTKRMAPLFGMLQSLEKKGMKYVVILDGDQDGKRAAEAMHRFGAQKNRHYFCLSRRDYRDKSGQSWDVEIEDMLAQSIVKEFVLQYPNAVEEQAQRQGVVKYTIQGRPVEKEGRTYEYKMMLVEYVRRHADLEDLTALIEVLKKARKCLGLREE